MECSCVRCKKCGMIMVINTVDLWKLKKCTKCESTDISVLDDEFDFVEVVDNEQ